MNMMQLDGEGYQYYEVYKSKCSQCIHFDFSRLCCPAYQKGIPKRYLSGEEIHTKINKNQTGDYVFTQT